MVKDHLNGCSFHVHGQSIFPYFLTGRSIKRKRFSCQMPPAIMQELSVEFYYAFILAGITFLCLLGDSWLASA